MMQLPERHHNLPEEELDSRIARAKRALGKELVILGHHYQRDEVIKHADFRGDSFRLARWAATHTSGRFIVFCGVHFMAETADILTGNDRAVILPDLEAGCTMAEMADLDQVEECWEYLSDLFEKRIIPVTYINSAADIKAFCGEHGGAVCTSSNAEKVFRWAMEKGEAVLFLPDEHLGRNTGARLGIRPEEMAVWRRNEAQLEPGRAASKPRLVLWQGFCTVHQRFTVDQVHAVRESFPGIRVIVHPECRHEVVQLADESGSTEYIVERVTESPPGSMWAIGTEINLVHRLAKENPDKTVLYLNPVIRPCTTMYRISPNHLLWALEELAGGHVVNRVTVPPDVAQKARIALERMLSIA